MQLTHDISRCVAERALLPVMAKHRAISARIVQLDKRAEAAMLTRQRFQCVLDRTWREHSESFGRVESIIGFKGEQAKALMRGREWAMYNKVRSSNPALDIDCVALLLVGYPASSSTRLFVRGSEGALSHRSPPRLRCALARCTGKRRSLHGRL